MEYSFEKCNIPNRPARQEYAEQYPRGTNMAYSLLQNEPTVPAAGSSPSSPSGTCHVHCYRSLPYSLRRTILRSYPITHLLPGIFEISQEAIAQQMNERTAMTGIAAQTVIHGWAALPASKAIAIGAI